MNFSELLLATLLPLPHLLQYISLFCAGALLEKKVEMDKRGMGVTDYNGMVTKPLGCRPPPISKESSMDRPTFLDKVSSAAGTWCTSQSVHSVKMMMISTVCLECVERNVMDMGLFLFLYLFGLLGNSVLVERSSDLILT